ncbi:MAG: SRPBCC domain-containing protein [Desulfobulbaceae bacterium]|nr:MAG: SRPBCC domain-containing protein [Desulfobulbaceae bacterium]
MTDLSLTINEVVHAPIEKVFDAWLDPYTLSKFIIPMKGMPEPAVENDPRVGGRFSIIMNFEGNSLPHEGSYLEIDRPHKLKFTWVSDHSPEGSTVTLVFASLEAGKTEVQLTHVKFFDEAAMHDHKGGWTTILETLDEYFAS